VSEDYVDIRITNNYSLAKTRSSFDKIFESKLIVTRDWGSITYKNI
jgi:hypothetical protein